MYLWQPNHYHGNRFPEGVTVLCIHEFHVTCTHVPSVHHEEDLPCSKVSYIIVCSMLYSEIRSLYASGEMYISVFNYMLYTFVLVLLLQVIQEECVRCYSIQESYSKS